MAIIDDIATTWRDHVTFGVPSSGAHEPVKSEIRALEGKIVALTADAEGLPEEVAEDLATFAERLEEAEIYKNAAAQSATEAETAKNLTVQAAGVFASIAEELPPGESGVVVFVDGAYDVANQEDFRGDPGGNSQAIGTFGAAATGLLDIDPGTTAVRTTGYDDSDDGGAAWYAEVASEPSVAAEAKFQDVDDRWFVVARGQPIRVEMFCDPAIADHTKAIQTALALADRNDAPLELTQMFNYSGDIIVPVGVRIYGARKEAGFKRIDEVRTTLTSGFAAGSGSKSFTVVSAAGLAVGMSVMFVDAVGGLFSPYDAYSHRPPVITAIVGTTITVNPRSTIRAHASGTFLQTAARGVVLLGNNELSGFTIDGNQVNQTDAAWQTHAEITVEGSGCEIEKMTVTQAPAESMLIAGSATDPDPMVGGVYVEGTKVARSTFDFAGCNHAHLSFTKDTSFKENTFRDANQRFGGINQAHQDGSIGYSYNNTDVTVSGNHFEGGLSGVGNVQSTDISGGSILSGVLTVTGNTFRNVWRPLHVIDRSANVVFAGNEVVADFPYVTPPIIALTPGSTVVVAGTNDANRTGSLIIADNDFKNVRLTFLYADDVTLADNAIILDDDIADETQNVAVTATNCSRLKITGGRIVGGGVAVNLLNFGDATTFVAGEIDGVTFARQKLSAVFGNHNNINVHMKGGQVITDDATADAAFAGVVLRTGMKVSGVDFTLSEGTHTAFNRTNWDGPAAVTGNVINGARPQAAGTFDFVGGAAFLVVNNPNIVGAGSSKSVVTITPANAAAATLQGGAAALYIDPADYVDGTSFLVRTADGTSPSAAARVFHYHVDRLNV